MLRSVRGREHGILRPEYVAQSVRRQRTLSLEVSPSNDIVTAHRGRVTALELDPSQHRLLLCASTDASVAIYDTERLSQAHKAAQSISEEDDRRQHDALFVLDKTTEDGHLFSVSCASWYPVDSGLLLTGSADRTVKAWDTETQQLAVQFDLAARVLCLAMRSPLSSPSHSLVAVGSEHSTVRICDLASGAQSHTLRGHKGPVSALSFSPSSPFSLFSGSLDGSLLLWDIRKANSCLSSFDEGRSQPSIRPPPRPASSPTKDTVASSARMHTSSALTLGPSSRSLPSSKGERLGRRSRLSPSPTPFRPPASPLPPPPSARAHSGALTSLLPLPHTSGAHLLSAGADGRVRLWDVASSAHILVNYGPLAKGTGGKDGRGGREGSGVAGGFPVPLQLQLAAAQDPPVVFCPSGTEVQVRSIWSGEAARAPLRAHFGPVQCCCYRPVDQVLFSAGADRSILAWTAPLSPASAAEDDAQPGIKRHRFNRRKYPLPDEDAWSD